MNGSTSASPATSWLTWPLQFAELATQTFRGNGIQAAPDVLAQNINPWTININSNNSSAPGTEQRILARHSYGRQLGRLMDAVDLLVDDSKRARLRSPAMSVSRTSTASRTRSTTSKSRRRNEGSRASRPT